MNINRKSSTPLYIQLAELLKSTIQSGKYRVGEKLPSERELMSHYHLSRNTVRLAIHLLNEEGLLYSNHGAGTFATNLAGMIRSRIDVFADHFQFLKLAGYVPSYQMISDNIVSADSYLSEKLLIESGTPVYRYEKLFLANDVPAIYTIDYVPAVKNRDRLELEDINLCENFMGYLEVLSGNVVEFGMSDLIPIAADKEIANKLQISVGQPILLMTEVFLDPLQQKPLGMGINYYGSFIQFNILRRRSQNNS